MEIPTWHYKVEQIVVAVQPNPNHMHQVQMKLDEIGMQGWEAVTAIVGNPGQVFVLFKRQGPQSFHLSGT